MVCSGLCRICANCRDFICILIDEHIYLQKTLKPSPAMMGKHSKYPFSAKMCAMSLLLSCAVIMQAHTDDNQILLTAVQVEISADCISDSIADLSGGEIVNHDYDIRLRWDGDTLVDLTTIDMRCDFSCKGDSLRLNMIETGRDVHIFISPAPVGYPGEFASTIKPCGGVVDSRAAGSSKNYITESMLINVEGDTLHTLMNKQLFVATLHYPSDNPYFNRIAVKELRSYYKKDTSFPIAVVAVSSYYDNEYRGIGSDILALDLISERKNQLATEEMYRNKAIANLSPFSRMHVGKAAPTHNSRETQHTGLPPTVDIIYRENSIIINTAGASVGAISSYSVIVSDVRGIVWHTGEFRDSAVISTSSYPPGEYQITVSDGTTAQTEKLTF